MDRIGLDAAARKRTGRGLFTLQMMLHYFKEAEEGDALAVSCHLLERDDKRMRVSLDMTDPNGERLAGSEQLLMSVAISEGAPRAAPWEFETLAALDALAKLSHLPQPPQAGAGVAMKRTGSQRSVAARRGRPHRSALTRGRSGNSWRFGLRSDRRARP